MTLDNDRNPIAPHHPSDPPPPRPAGQVAGAAQTEAGGVAAPDRSPVEAPSKSADTDDATSSRAIVRAILGALPLDVRAAVVAAVLAWCRSLAAVAGMVGRRELGAVEALPLADAATETLMERDGRPPHDVVAAMLGAWWATGPYDLARQVSKGTTSAEDFGDAVAFLVQLQGDADALAYVTSGARAEHTAAPRIIRCAMPAGVDRLDVPRAGVTFLPPPLTRGDLDALTRDAARELAGHAAAIGADDTGAELVTDARAAALDVHAGEGPASPAAALAELGGALAAVAYDAASRLTAPGAMPPDALTLADRAGAAGALAALAARAFDAARAVCVEAVAQGERRVDSTRWPSAPVEAL